MQSWTWSVFKEASGHQVFRLGCFQEDELVGGAITYSVTSSFGSSPLMLPHGPVLSWENMAVARQCLDLLGPELERLASGCGAPVVRLEPTLPLQVFSKFFAAAQREPVDLLPTPTWVVPVDRCDDDILKAMKPKGRYNVRLSLRKGVEVASGISPEDVRDFHELFELTCLRHYFSGEDRAFFDRLVQHLASENMVQVYIARYRGIPLAAAVVVFCGDRATYLYGGTSPFLRHTMSSYALHWKIMQDARARGCHVYDLYGVAPDGQEQHPYARFTAFKKKFGGQLLCSAGAHDLYSYDRFTRMWFQNMEALVTDYQRRRGLWKIFWQGSRQQRSSQQFYMGP
jgi:lipid II:glycine glycyltransferase (peptidoglycan interpeptide bridge formation enzyme)